MGFEHLDNDELLRLSLAAMAEGRDADSMVTLKTMLDRDPGNARARYLLAAQHAQLGMLDRAEEGFRSAIGGEDVPATARLQLGQLLLLKGAKDEAREVLAALAGKTDALAAYSRALMAAANEDVPTVLAELEAGFALPQEVPALEVDMRRLHGQLSGATDAGVDNPVDGHAAASSTVAPTPMFLSSYSREL